MFSVLAWCLDRFWANCSCWESQRQWIIRTSSFSCWLSAQITLHCCALMFRDDRPVFILCSRYKVSDQNWSWLGFGFGPNSFQWVFIIEAVCFPVRHLRSLDSERCLLIFINSRGRCIVYPVYIYTVRLPTPHTGQTRPLDTISATVY